MYGLRILNTARATLPSHVYVARSRSPSIIRKELFWSPELSRCRFFSGHSLKPTKVSRGSPDSQGQHEVITKKSLQTLAIETSCDDTSVAVLRVHSPQDDALLSANVLFHEKVTAKSESYNGIHPLVALHSHQTELALLVQKAIQHVQPTLNEDGCEVRRPDFVTVTRGPGMRANLSVGLDTAKGLATAWDVPLLGVHHMQAHALTSRLCWALEQTEKPATADYNKYNSGPNLRYGWAPHEVEPKFPFLTVLASGGHTLLVNSKSLLEHTILAETNDIALGDCLDKAARAILPASALHIPYGRALEDFAFGPHQRLEGSYEYTSPTKRGDELATRETKWGWSLSPPLSESKGGDKSSRRMVYSFAGLLSSVERLAASQQASPDINSPNPDIANASKTLWLAERREMARELQRVAFEHLASRILLYISDLTPDRQQALNTIVVSGGVASNTFLRHVLRSILDVRGYKHIKLSFPPIELCTDNALMIAWAGMEMYDAGYESELSIQPIRRWSMDSRADDGGIMGVGGWKGKKDRGADVKKAQEQAAREQEARDGEQVKKVMSGAALMILVASLMSVLGLYVSRRQLELASERSWERKELESLRGEKRRWVEKKGG